MPKAQTKYGSLVAVILIDENGSVKVKGNDASPIGNDIMRNALKGIHLDGQKTNNYIEKVGTEYDQKTESANPGDFSRDTQYMGLSRIVK